ncbi:DUF5694 domain-containing protein [Pontixanthobacter sp. CEM42]|uniref:DUF5694 domain-containing protein n=1 Tax=Pontixanthobacter sp. CEM42 TaxID=2792077 RepID=UPI001ADEFB64|nr:DUF5694 domain-containing protein [Pontixanthobacter sp. CEM42]
MNLLKLVSLCLVTVLMPAALNAQTDDQAEQSETIKVMVLGLYHFDNPGADMVNSEVDDMLAPHRQREIIALVESLAQWRPTKIAVENEAPLPSLSMEEYARADELLATSRNETVQIGYRLGVMLGHNAVYGYDERGGDSEPDYFPMGKVQAFAQANGGMELMGSLIAEIQAVADQETAERPSQTVAQSLLQHNDTDRVSSLHNRLYYSLLRIGDGDQQPGAELNAYWYMRNAKMFAKLDMIAEAGDRVLVLAGSGHATWLKHFVERMPGYELVEALPYIEDAANN